VVVEGLLAGGQLMQTTDVENYPGFPEGIMGPELMEKFKNQAERFGTTFIPGDVTTLDLTKRPFVVTTEEGSVEARALIIATGASPKTLELPGEKEYAGHGVSYCATCDGFFFRNQEIVVVGGGDTAMEEANYLARLVSEVTVVHRRDSLRASKIMQERALANPKIKFLWNSEVIEALGVGEQRLRGVKVKNLVSGEVSEHLLDGLFIAIGHQPNTGFLKGVLPMDERGYLQVDAGTPRTSIPGVFAAGDVADSVYRQAVTAAGSGCMAAIEAERWLEAQAHAETHATAKA